MSTITRSWKRFVAVGCPHAEFINPVAAREFFDFCDSFKPQFRIHLGDNWDTTAWRTGASQQSGKDSDADVESDFSHGTDFLLNYRPNLFFLGNHDARPYEYLQAPNAIVRSAARHFVGELEALVKKELKAQLVEYNILTGWRMIGDTAFGHGYMFNEHAARDHAEMLGRNVVIAHIHTLAASSARFVGAPMGYAAGCLIDPQKAKYAHRRRATHRWRNGWVYGEYCHNATKIFLHAASQPQPFIPRCPRA